MRRRTTRWRITARMDASKEFCSDEVMIMMMMMMMMRRRRRRKGKRRRRQG